MAKTKDKDETILKDGERLRVPLTMMDEVQRSIAQHSRSWTMDSNTAYGHRPGYRVGQKLLTDNETRETLADAYESYEKDLCSRYKTAAPEPVLDTKAAVLDDEWDDSGDFYAQYDARLRDA